MPKTDLKLVQGEYVPVAERVAQFWARHPAGRIVTDLVASTEGQVTFRASVFRDTIEAAPAATGWASERFGDGDINSVACLENAETSAIGRALANLGFAASERRAKPHAAASAERVHGKTAVRGRVGARESADPVDAPVAPRSNRLRSASAEDTGLQGYANAVADVVRLLDIAERLGFDVARASSIRERLVRGAVPPSGVTRFERSLRAWLESRDDVRFETATGRQT